MSSPSPAGTEWMAGGARSSSIFCTGCNCCAVAHADRVALLIDGEAYFRAFAQAAERARHSIVILGWDFDSRVRLHCEPVKRRDPPAQLGDFLNWLVKRRRGLQVYVLDWDYPMVFGTDREFPPLYGLGWKPRRRVHLRYDNTHPVGGSHHQKIVVIDDSVAFSGGLDLACRRWDTTEHCAEDERRVVDGDPYPPFHDLMMAVDGEAARTLGRIARARWCNATQHALPPVGEPGDDPWPPQMRPDLEDVEVAIARTAPPREDRPAVREVETLFVDMIAAARQRIYIENQYFTAHKIGEALAGRLAERDGPEIMLVLRLLSHGWLEEHTMHVLRTRLIQQLHAADKHQRFHVYYPHIDGLKDGHCIDVHSKVMIVDEEVLRIGSANLCNRSMGMDTECDVALEARGEARVETAIRNFRNRLLGEHLGADPQRVQQEVQRAGTLHGAIAALQGKTRTLKTLDDLPQWSDAIVSLAEVADIEKPVSLDHLIDEFAPDTELHHARPAWGNLALIALAMIGLTAAWRYTPLAGLVNPGRVTAWAREFAGQWWAPLAILTAYTPACLVMFPRPVITLAAVIAFGPWLGFTFAMSGILIATLITYVAGRLLKRSTVRNLAGEKLNSVSETLRQRGLLAVAAVRLVPLAPFAVAGLVAGAIHIKLWHFMLGTFIGMLPGALAATVFGDQLEAAIRDPAEINYWLLATIVVLLILATLAVRQWLFKTQPHHHPHGPSADRAR